MPQVIQLVFYSWGLVTLMFALHYMGPDIGAGPFVVVVTGAAAFLETQISIYIVPFPGIILSLSSHIVLPSILAALIVLYIVNGTVAARQMLYGIMLVAGLIALFMFVGNLSIPLGISGIGGWAERIFRAFDWRTVIGSLVAFGLDVIAIAIVYQGTINTFPKLPIWLAACIALLAALWTDAIVFTMFSDLGSSRFIRILPGAVVGKTLAAFVISPILAIYLGRYAVRLPNYQGAYPRPTFDLFLNRSERLSLELVRVKAALSAQEAEVMQEREKANELRDFINEISHDLRTPLTSINLKVFQLNRTTDLAAQKEKLQDLSRLTNHINEMIEDMLTLSRLDQQRAVPHQESKVNLVVQAVCTMLQPHVESKQIKLVYDLTPEDPSYLINADDLNRVVLNLVSNAIRYTPAEGVITIKTMVEKDWLHLQVIDTGIGINTDDLPHIFDRFFRAQNAKRLDDSGSGLGLAIVKRVIDLYGGSIKVDSQPQRGSTFSISLPTRHV